MQVFVTILMIASGSALGAYLGASESSGEIAFEIAFYEFIGVTIGFLYRHFFYE